MLTPITLAALCLSALATPPEMFVSDPVAGDDMRVFFEAEPLSSVTLLGSIGGPPLQCSEGANCLQLQGNILVLGIWSTDEGGRTQADVPLAPSLAGYGMALQVLQTGNTWDISPAWYEIVAAVGSDTDGDGMTDVHEGAIGADPTLFDMDGDGLRDGDEVLLWADAWIPDTDGDGLLDGPEVWYRHTDPAASDTDSDGLSDAAELFVHGTNPLLEDSDGGGAIDGDEVTYQTDPLDLSDDMFAGSDIDGDWLIDAIEFALGTDAWVPDTDGDGMNDGFEVYVTLTDPNLADTDLDGLTDTAEIFVHGTNPSIVDSDGGGASDGDEITYQTDPLDLSDDMFAGSDIDGDWLIDTLEFAMGTDAWVADTDGDGIWDGPEVYVRGTNPLLADTDGGGASDGSEVLSGTDPLEPGDD